MDQAISIVVGVVVLVGSLLMDVVREHPIVLGLLAGLFVIGHIVSSERNEVIRQLRQELQSLERHIDSKLDSIERGLWDLSKNLP
jgi:hypothetical protein